MRCSIISQQHTNCESNSLISRLQQTLAPNPFWSWRLSLKRVGTFTLHLAIFREPYLSFIMEGKKTVETRFARRACAPYMRVADGDVVLLKRAAGKIVGICTVEKVWYYQLDPSTFSFIRRKFGSAICPADASFWEEKQQATVATLMLVGNVTPLEKIEIKKRDRRGWVVLDKNKQ